jgi:uncharacterized Tic20 family protein
MSADPNVIPPSAGSPTNDEKTWGMLAHFLGIVTGFIGALVIWLIKKDEMPFVEEQGKEALNFQITILIGYVVCMVLTVVLIGAFLMPILWIFNLVMCLLAGIKVQKGEHYKYPFALRLIK